MENWGAKMDPDGTSKQSDCSRQQHHPASHASDDFKGLRGQVARAVDAIVHEVV